MTDHIINPSVQCSGILVIYPQNEPVYPITEIRNGQKISAIMWRHAMRRPLHTTWDTMPWIEKWLWGHVWGVCGRNVANWVWADLILTVGHDEGFVFVDSINQSFRCTALILSSQGRWPHDRHKGLSRLLLSEWASRTKRSVSTPFPLDTWVWLVWGEVIRRDSRVEPADPYETLKPGSPPHDVRKQIFVNYHIYPSSWMDKN